VQKAISKYGLAAHLALLAVAPLFLFPFCGEEWTARTLLWLSLLAALWLFIEPSRRQGEMLHDARGRVFVSVVRDPLFWFSLVLVLMALVRWLNGGVKMAYDAENMVWSLRGPVVPFLPGSVSGSGFLPFAVSVAVCVLMQSARHALGKSARSAFVAIASFLAGLASVIAAVSAACGHEGVLAASRCSTVNASFAGNAFGVYMVASMVAIVVAFERKWKRAVPAIIVAASGCGIGLYMFAPDIVVVAYSAAAVVVFAFSLAYAQFKLGGLVLPKCLAVLFISAAVGSVFFMGLVPESVKEARFAFISEEGGKLVPESFLAARDTLSSIAFAVCKDHSWLGSGLGSFPMDIRFNAAEADWSVIAATQMSALNGWWQLLAERGIAGMIFFLSPLFFLAWTYAVRFVDMVRGAFSSRHYADIMFAHPVCALGPVVVAVTAACGFMDCSFARPEAMMAAAAMFALSGSAFPAARKTTDDESDTEK